jgi:hypothetical protein
MNYKSLLLLLLAIFFSCGRRDSATGPVVPVPTAESQTSQASPPLKPVASEIGSRISGSVWLTNNDGSSNLLRGIGVYLLRNDDVSAGAVVERLKLKLPPMEDLLKLQRRLVELKKQTSSTDPIELKTAEQQAADLQVAVNLTRDFIRTATGRVNLKTAHDGAVLLAAPDPPDFGQYMSAATISAVNADVDGKYNVENVGPGWHYIYAQFRTQSFFADWLLPVNVIQGADIKLDLFNGNTAILINFR